MSDLGDRIPPAAESPIRGVILDHGNVLYQFDFGPVALALARFGLDESTARSILSGRDESEAFGQFQLGLLDVDGLASAMRVQADPRRAKEPLTSPALREVLNRAWVAEVPAMVELLDVLLGRGYVVRLLTNINPVHYDYCLRHSQAFRRLGEDGIFASHLLGVRKPDAAIFKMVLQGMGLPASACLLIDDDADNVQAARSLGLGACLFRPDKVGASVDRIVAALSPGCR